MTSGEQPARDQLAECATMLARRIRTLRQRDRDWSMRTSELVSTGMVRILGATDGGRAELSRGRFLGLLEAVARSVVVDGIRRRRVRRAAQEVLRQQSRSESGDWTPDAADARALADRLVAEMTADERGLVRLRLGGLEWTEVAAELGISAEAARQRWSALKRRMRELAER
jgi:RNA polymerase sigma factor (sigma-70 family)